MWLAQRLNAGQQSTLTVGQHWRLWQRRVTCLASDVLCGFGASMTARHGRLREGCPRVAARGGSNVALRKLAARYVVDRGMTEEAAVNQRSRCVVWVCAWVSRYRKVA